MAGSVVVIGLLVLTMVVASVAESASAAGPGAGADFGITVSVDSASSLPANASNQVLVSGTVTCDLVAKVATHVALHQTQAQQTEVSGTGFVEAMPCGPTPVPWSSLLSAVPQPFANGAARLSITADAATSGPAILVGSGSVDIGTVIAGATPVSSDAMYYLALGDSLVTGFAAGPGEGYTDLLLAHYRQTIPNLFEVNLGCNSVTTGGMLNSKGCTFGGLSQTDAAVAFLNAHRGHIALVTIDIGGNDVVFCADADCFNRTLPSLDANLATIMRRLREAAGPDVHIYGMNYFNPLLGNWLNGPAGQARARDTAASLVVLNQHLAADYAAVNAPTADVATAFAADDFTTLVPSERWGTVPLNAFNACTWLDITCVVGGPPGFGDDANAAGYRVIADAFIAIIDLNAPVPTLSTQVPGPAPSPSPLPEAVSPAAAVQAAPAFTG